ncbi:MAG: hypothetical protein GY795_11170, partial [Desulfobacterales bacterium]|nr:hypothetical protein [Desulfobacterales bacterium]
TGGTVITPIGTGDDSGQALILRSDGKIIVTGYSDNGSDKDFAAVQYNADGTPDTEFGTGGKVTTPIGGGDDLCYAGAIQSDGKIVLAGYSHNGSDYDFAAVRYNSDGTLDEEFGTDGKVTQIRAGDDKGYAVTIQSDGKIIIAGKSHNGSDYDFAAVRYGTDGTPDTEFGTDGRVTTVVETADDIGFGIAVQPDGNIVVTGKSYRNESYNINNIATVRYLSGNALPPEPAEIKITASDGAENDNFGTSVSVSGDYAIVGTAGSDSAYIFEKDGISWSQQAKITASDGAENDYFSRSVSISGDYAIVGASRDNDNCGSVYIFKKSGISWSQQAKITATDGMEWDGFGSAVSISGDYAIVGSAGDDDYGKSSGSAYILKKDGIYWSIHTKITANDGAERDSFGFSVSISGDYAIVGACGDNDSFGSAYIFKRDEESWSQQAKIISGEWGLFGRSVSISGDYAIVGTSLNNSAYIFKRDGTGWNQQIKLTPDMPYSIFGISVSISGDYAIVSAINYAETGLVHIFKRDGTNWNQEIILTAGDGVKYGYNNSAISGKSVIAGFPFDDGDGKHDFAGSAYIYTLPQSALYEKSDINRDNKTDLTDAVIALKIVAGVNIDDMIPAGYSVSDTDVNGDNRIGMEEVLYIMKKIMFE